MAIQNWNPLLQLFNELIRSVIIVVASAERDSHYAVGCVIQIPISSWNPHPITFNQTPIPMDSVSKVTNSEREKIPPSQ